MSYYNTDSDRRNWQRAKIAARRMATRLYALAQPGLFGEGEQRLDNRARRMSECGNRILAAGCPECNIRHIIRASFCRDRLCPLCNWRRAIRFAAAVRQAAAEIKTPLYLATFTLSANAPWPDLGTVIDDMGRRWQRLIRRIAGRVRGYVKVVEVSKGTDGLAHLHLHVLLDGFGLTGAGLTALWGARVHVERVTDPGRIGYYMGKGATDLQLSDEDMISFMRAVHGRRLHSSSGTLRLQNYETSAFLAGGGGDGGHTCPHCGGVLVRTLERWDARGSCYVKEAIRCDARSSLSCTGANVGTG